MTLWAYPGIETGKEEEEIVTDIVLETRGLRKTYGDFVAVDGLSLRVRRGEILGLLGPNGAGKTTTLHMLVGLLEPDQGEIIIDGMEFSRHPQAAKARIGFVPQDLALYPTLSARDNLYFFGRIYGLWGHRLRQRTEEALALVGLLERADKPVRSYSGGMKRRLNIAAGLLHRPILLFLDEPTVGVDPQSRHAILEGIKTLNRSGVTVLYTTHYMEEAQYLCHRVAIMDAGHIVALDTPDALIRSLGAGLLVVGVSEDVAGKVMDYLGNEPAVGDVQRRDGKLHIRAHDVQEALMALIRAINAVHAPLSSLTIFEPNLETVFLHLTGKQLRD